jgi:Zn-dependent protease/CBS domain-containing protein
VRVARIFGIDVEVDWTWVLALLLFTWVFSLPSSPFGELDPGLRVAVAFICAMLLFASVLIHELAHAAMARHYDLPVNGIRLFIFGGVSRVVGTISTQTQEAAIAVIGPISTLVVAAISLGIAVVVPSQAVHELFLYLAYANVALAIFNMLPAYPLDGGRVAHAISWGISGSRERATDVTVTLSRVFAIVFLIGGGLLIANGSVVSGASLAVVGWLVLAASRAEWMRSGVYAHLKNLTAAQIADPPLLVLPSTATSREAAEAMAKRRAHFAAVVLGDRLLGVVTVAAVARAPHPDDYLGAVMTRTEELDPVQAEAPATAAVDRLLTSGRSVLPVLSADTLVGFVTQATLARILTYERLHRRVVV